MFQKIDSTVTARIVILSLLATLVIALSGCGGLWTKADSEHDRFVTGGYQGNETLAVLLPKSGRFAGAAKAVRAGIVAARKADPEGERPKLRFYNSAAGSISALVKRAAKGGARLAIGPLQKPAVKRLAGAAKLPIPVLALNQATAATKSSNLYQLSLAPEGEVSEIVDRVWGEGHRKAVILYPKGKWGNRMLQAFRRQWKAQGGALVAAQAFNPKAADLSGMVKKTIRAGRTGGFHVFGRPREAGASGMGSDPEQTRHSDASLRDLPHLRRTFRSRRRQISGGTEFHRYPLARRADAG